MTLEILIFIGLSFILFLLAKLLGTKILVGGSLSILASTILLKYLIIDSSSITLSPLMTIISFLISVIFIYTTLKGFLRNKRIYGNKGVFFLIISSMLLSVFLLSSYFYFIPEDYFSFRSQFRDLFFLYDYLLGIFMLLPFISFILISKGDK